MSLYDSGIQLLPRPPRSAFSMGNESTRATIPDFNNVTELSHFTNRLFNWHIPISSLFIQAIFTSVLIFIMVIVVTLIMATKIYQGKFWLIRVIRKSNETINVPNPIVVFLIMTGFYGLLFTPIFIVFCRHFSVSHTGPPNNSVLWFTLPWLPLCFGLYFAIVGTYYATPAQPRLNYEEYDDDDEDSVGIFLNFKSWIIKKLEYINNSSFLLILPIIALTIIIVVPSFICNTIWNDALHMEEQWQTDYSSASIFTQEMVHQSQRIWYRQLQAAKIGAIIFILYTSIGFILGSTYIYVAIRLIVSVYVDLTRTRNLLSADDVILDEEPAVLISQTIKDALEANQASRPPSSSLLDRLQRFKSRHSNRVNSKDAKNSSCNSNIKLLESAFVHIIIQALAIGLGTIGLGGISLSFSTLIYGKLEQPSLNGGNLFEDHIGRIWIALMYVSVVFGSLSIFTVAYKTYEPVFQRQAPTTSTQINFKDIVKGISHIKSTIEENTHLPSQAYIDARNNRVMMVRRQRAATFVSLPPCDTIVEETHSALRLQPRPRRPHTAPSSRDKNDNEEGGQMDWSVDASTAASSPASILKHL